MDKNGVLKNLLKSMRQKASQDFSNLLLSIAAELDAESEPLKDYQEDDAPEGFDAIWQDR